MPLAICFLTWQTGGKDGEFSREVTVERSPGQSRRNFPVLSTGGQGDQGLLVSGKCTGWQGEGLGACVQVPLLPFPL